MSRQLPARPRSRGMTPRAFLARLVVVALLIIPLALVRANQAPAASAG